MRKYFKAFYLFLEWEPPLHDLLIYRVSRRRSSSSSVDPQNVHRICRQPLYLVVLAHPEAPWVLQKKCYINQSSTSFALF